MAPDIHRLIMDHEQACPGFIIGVEIDAIASLDMHSCLGCGKGFFFQTDIRSYFYGDVRPGFGVRIFIVFLLLLLALAILSLSAVRVGRILPTATFLRHYIFNSFQ